MPVPAALETGSSNTRNAFGAAAIRIAGTTDDVEGGALVAGVLG